jgi:hypothetical protein
METRVRRIPLPAATNLEQAIQDVCTNMSVGGLRLVTCFVFGTELVLIFQS